MPLSAKNIKIRIRSIKNIGKITKAMELVSATKMRKSSRAAVSGRPYDLSATEIMESIILAGASDPTGKMLKGKFFAEVPEPKRIAVLLFSSNRGLCGSFNSQIVSFARKSLIEKKENGAEISWITVGKKGTKILLRLGEKVTAEFLKPESAEEADEFFPVAKFLTEKFLVGEFDQVLVAYTDFVSALRQTPRVVPLLPFADYLPKDAKFVEPVTEEGLIFEPSKEEVLEYLAPRYIEDKLYQALLESNASEHSARMAAMRNASDAAHDLIDDLVFESNELRQGAITREIAEIAAGFSAV